MDVSPAITEIGGYDQSFPAEDTDKEEEEEDLCRICRSPEEPGNPLRYPCLCRGSIKYVHQDCLLLWLNRRRYKNCEVCGRSYSFVPIYAENAPERLPCNEFLIGVLLRVARYMKLIAPYMKLIVPWIVVILFNTYCNCLQNWGKKLAAEFQREFLMSRKFASLLLGLLYTILILCFMTCITIIRVDLNARRFRAEDFIDNGLRPGVFGGVVKVLWKYTKILCDWYFHKLIYFFGQPRRLIHVPPIAPIHEFGVIRRLLFFLDDDTFAFLAISVYVRVFFVLLPFSTGWIVLATVGGSNLSKNSTVFLGYMMILSISFGYFGILFASRQNSFPGIVQWFSLGFHFITVKLPCLLRLFSVKAWKNRFVINDAFVLCFKIGVMPCIIGWWLGICTSPFFETTIFQRFEKFSDARFMMNMRWILGFSYLMIAGAYMELIQEIIHKRAFWYLLDVTDPDYKITKLYIGHTFSALACHGVLLVILFHLPIKAITLISPSFLPLDFWFTDEIPFVGAFTIYPNLMRYGPQRLINLIKPAMKHIVHNWIITVSSWLQLSDFLLEFPRGEGIHRPDQNVRPMMQPRRHYDDNPRFSLYSVAEGSMVVLNESQNAEDDIKDQRENRLLPRIALMLMLAALSSFLISTAFIALPILAGRVFSGCISFIMPRFGVKHDDLFGFWIGCELLRAIYISTCFAFDHIWRGRTDLLLKYIFIRIRNYLFFFIWISVVPGLIGLLIDLMIIIPSRVPLYESPVYFLIQDWLIGLVVLHIWICLTMLTPISCFATESWRTKFKRIRNVGINRVPSMWLLRDVIGSIINTLLTTLSIPYLLVKALFPLLGFSQSINSGVERLIWPALLGLITVWFMAKLTRDLIVYLHQMVFNERYLVGERVDNLTEDLLIRV